jgi:hypothetical protein
VGDAFMPERIGPQRIGPQVPVEGPSEPVFTNIKIRRKALAARNPLALVRAARVLAVGRRVYNGHSESRMSRYRFDGSRAMTIEDLFDFATEGEPARQAVRAILAALQEEIDGDRDPSPVGLREAVAAVVSIAGRAALEGGANLSDGRIDQIEADRYDRVVDEMLPQIEVYRAARAAGAR